MQESWEKRFRAKFRMEEATRYFKNCLCWPCDRFFKISNGVLFFYYSKIPSKCEWFSNIWLFEFWEVIWVHIWSFEFRCGHLRSFEVCWGHLKSFEAIWCNLRSFDTILRRFRPFAVFCGPLRSLKGHLRPTETTWHTLRSLEVIWGRLSSLEYTWDYFRTV